MFVPKIALDIGQNVFAMIRIWDSNQVCLNAYLVQPIAKMEVFIQIVIAVKMARMTRKNINVKNVRVLMEFIQIVNATIKQQNIIFSRMSAYIVQKVAQELFQIVYAVSNATKCSIRLKTIFSVQSLVGLLLEYGAIDESGLRRKCPYDSTGDYPNCKCNDGGLFEDGDCKNCEWPATGSYPDCICEDGGTYNKVDMNCQYCLGGR